MTDLMTIGQNLSRGPLYLSMSAKMEFYIFMTRRLGRKPFYVTFWRIDMITVTPQGSYCHMKQLSLTERQTYNMKTKKGGCRLPALPLFLTINGYDEEV